MVTRDLDVEDELLISYVDTAAALAERTSSGSFVFELLDWLPSALVSLSFSLFKEK